MIENIEKQTTKFSEILNNQLDRYKEFIEISFYSPSIIKSGITKFESYKNYIDTSSVNGLNLINKYQLISFENKPSRANMQPTANSVWFAKMKEANKNLIITKFDYDLLNKFILSTGFLGIKSSDKLPLSLLVAFIISDNFQKQRDLNSVGTTMSGINNETFMKIMVPKLTDKQIREFEIKNIHLVNRLSFLRRKLNKLNMIKNLLLDKYF